MRDAQDLEGYSVFALFIYLDWGDTELWGIYSNANACCEAGKKICESYLNKGVDATYRCESYDVIGE